MTKRSNARTLINKVWGSNWIESIPVGWRSSVKMKETVIPGMPNGTDPDATDDTKVSSQITAERINEVEKRTTEVEAVLSDKIEHEQDYDAELDIEIPKTRYLTADNAEVGMVRRIIRAFNPKVSEVEKFDLTAIAAVFDAYSLVFPGSTNIQLPDELVSVSSFVETQSSEGDDHEAVTVALITNAGSLSVPARASANSAIVAMPDVNPVIRSRWGANKKITHYIFLLPSPVTSAQVLTKLAALLGTSITAWPKFNPETVTIFCIGGRASVQAKAVAQYQVGFNECSDCNSSESLLSSGNGASKEVGITIKAVRIPATIHPEIAVSGFASEAYSVDATVTADAYAVSDDRTESATISAYITPTAISQTTGATTIPTTGFYLLNTDSSPYKYGYVRLHCEVLNAADL